MVNFHRAAGSLYALTIFSFTLAIGCGGSSDLHAIGGKVTVDDAPAAGAILSFQAAAGGSGNSSGTVADEQGRYEIPKKTGLKAGTYDVTIQYWKETAKIYTDPCTGQTHHVTEPVQFAQQGKLQVVVGESEDGQFDFSLTSAKR